MISKEEIVREQYEKIFASPKYDKSVNRKMNFSYISPAMDQYAKQQAEGFGQYIGEYGWEMVSEPHSKAGQWISPTNLQYGFKTTSQLYTIYLQQKNKP